MVRINLLKKTGSGPAKHPRSRLLVPILVVAPIGAVIFITLPRLRSYLPQRMVKTEAPAIPPVTAPQEPTSFTPTVARAADIVEDVVREIAHERSAAGLRQSIDLPYADLSFLEKVNYEVLYAKTVFAILSRAVPEGIGLKSLEIDNFQTMYAVGLGTSRELVSSTFIALKTEKLTILPQPLSYITANNGDGYRFVVTGKTTFGLDLTDPFQASDHLPARDDLPLLARKMVRIGETSGVSFTEAPRPTDAEKIAAYRRIHYRGRCSSSYSDFVRYIGALQAEKIPCAFRKITLGARTGTTVDGELLFYFTVRE